jgi:hypothetical protein
MGEESKSNIPDVRKMRLEPGDTVVIRYFRKLNTEEIQRIEAALSSIIPAENKVIVLDDETELGILKVRES